MNRNIYKSEFDNPESAREWAKYQQKLGFKTRIRGSQKFDEVAFKRIHKGGYYTPVKYNSKKYMGLPTEVSYNGCSKIYVYVYEN